MHRAAAPLAEPLREAKDFGQRLCGQFAHRIVKGFQRVDSRLRDMGQGLGKELVMRAMRAVHLIARKHGHGRADRAALLPDGGMGGAVDQTLRGQFQHLFLEGADQVHLRQHGQAGRRGKRGTVIGGRADLAPEGGGGQVVKRGHVGVPGVGNGVRRPESRHRRAGRRR